MNIRHDPCKACHTGTSSINKEQLRGHGHEYKHDPCKACHTGTSSINKEQLRGHGHEYKP